MSIQSINQQRLDMKRVELQASRRALVKEARAEMSRLLQAEASRGAGARERTGSVATATTETAATTATALNPLTPASYGTAHVRAHELWERIPRTDLGVVDERQLPLHADELLVRFVVIGVGVLALVGWWAASGI